MKKIFKNLVSTIKKMRISNILSFILWPVLFSVLFITVYNRSLDLHMENVELQASVTASDIAERFKLYTGNIDVSLRVAANVVEYMLDNGYSDEQILEYITEASKELGIVSSSGSRGIFGVFGGTFMDGVEWHPDPSYDPTKRPWYQEAVRNGGKFAFAGPYYNFRTNEYVVTACKLLKDKKSVIAFAIDYETFRSMTTGLVDSDDEHIIFIMGDDGDVFVNSMIPTVSEDKPLLEEKKRLVLYDALVKNAGKVTFTLPKNDVIEDSYIVSKRHIVYELYVVTLANASTEYEEVSHIALIYALVIILGIAVIFGLNIYALSKDIERREYAQNLASISNIYVTMHKVDMVNDTFSQIICTDFRVGEDITTGGPWASMNLPRVMKDVVDQRSLESVLKFVDFSTLNERMKNVDTITEEFLNYEHIWHRARFVVVDRDKDGKLKNIIFATEIIDEEKRARDRFQYLAETDQLTDIYNRGSGEKKIRDLLLKNVGGMFIIFDVDKFKLVNDNYGHDVGDEVLIGIAESMRHTFRERDIIMRMGGDEFSAYIPGVFHEEEGRLILWRLCEAISGMEIKKMGDHKVSVSIGAAFYYSTDSFSFDELYRRADSCTYESKKAGGNTVRFYKRMDDETSERV